MSFPAAKRDTVLKLAMLLTAVTCLSRTLAAAPIVPVVIGGSGETLAMASTAEFDTILPTQLTQEVDIWSIQLIARMQGGPLLFDQTYTVPFLDPQVQAGITQAGGLLTAAGAVALLGPALLSSLRSLQSSQSDTQIMDRQTTQTYLGAQAFVGPQVIFTGGLGVCQSYSLDAGNYASLSGCSGYTPYADPVCFSALYTIQCGTQVSIVPGSIIVEGRLLSLVTIFQTTTTTDTYLNTLLYEIEGIPPGSPVPEPGSTPLVLCGLAGLSVAARARTRAMRKKLREISCTLPRL
ncbi:MAG: hypothetical protein HZB13_20945 [Acidobacteria bacterium]|nr:hypothetical protein [Acidobacteriota bacterium]